MKSEKRERSYSETLGDFAVELAYERIPPDVAVKVKTHLIDSVGVGMAGSTMEWCRQASSVVERLDGPPEATVLGSSKRIAASNAAMANGIAIACMDYDDTDYEGGGHHMSRSVVPAALAAAERVHASGRELISAITAGYEVVGRVGSALLLDRYGPRAASAAWTEDDLAKHHQMQRQGGALVRGFIPGLFGSTVAAGRLLDLNADQLASAQGLVGGLGLFLGQSHREGADGLMLNAGWAAHAGILAALWAREGLLGPRYIYEGDRGMLSVIGGELQDASRLTAGLGAEWNSMNNMLKFYPAGHGTHHFIESLKALIEEHALRAEDIEQIECRAPSQRVEFHFLPVEAKLHPTPYTARFSMPYLLARLTLDHDLGALSFTPEKLAEPAVMDLARRVTYVSDETAWYGEKRGLVTVTLRGGRSLSRSSPDLIGFPARPHTRSDVLGKFRSNAKLVFDDASRIDAFAHALETLEGVEDVAQMMALAAAE